MADVYTIVCNHKGKTHRVLFYPAGYGVSYDGYVTSFQQLKEALQAAFAVSGGNLAYITKAGTRKDISQDHELDAAVEDLSNGSVLAVTLVGGGGKKGKKGNKNINKNKKNKQAQDGSSDSQEDSCTSSSGSAPAKGGGRNNNDNKQVKCHHCDAKKWSGNRYQYHTHHAYHLCHSCYNKLDKETKKTWVLVCAAGKNKGKGKNKNKKEKNSSDEEPSDSDPDSNSDAESQDSSTGNTDIDNNKKKNMNKKNNKNKKGGSSCGDNKALQKIMDRFVYQEADCYHCNARNWWGSRYVYCTNHYYSLCNSCYQKLSASQKNTWKLAALPWEDVVPDAPLQREEGVPIREDVRHLQYILTVLGFMKLENTSEFSGSYQYYTEKAVADFRNKHKVKGGNSKCYGEM